MNRPIRVLQLYPRDMNIYGDWGNVLVILKRLKWQGYDAELVEYNPGDVFPEDVDIVIGGGGQDSGQAIVVEDLQSIGPKLHAMANNDVPMLVICGLYQLFGHAFVTHDGTTLPGIGIFDLETKATNERLIGNIVTNSELFGDIIGYENHSGQTYLGPDTQPLGMVALGAGNNSTDGHEGAMYRNVIGTYLHGSLLPKNPRIADWLIDKALSRVQGVAEPLTIDDSRAEMARQVAAKRPR